MSRSNDGPRPRFEFRAFGRGFGRIARRMRERGRLEQIGDREDLYLLSASDAEHGVKVRDGRVEVKRLLERRDGLERWAPSHAAELPVAADFVREVLAPALGLASPSLRREHYALADLLAELVEPEPCLAAVRVHKRRASFTLEGIRAEHAVLEVDGEELETLALESPDPQALVRMVALFGLREYPNRSYPAALRALRGLDARAAETG